MSLSRRDFLAAGAALPLLSTTISARVEPPVKLKKAVKYSMINAGRTVRDRFDLAKKCGFEGVEMDSPSGVNRRAAIHAAKETGVVIHGVVCSTHWSFPLSDPDAKIRAEGAAGFETALEDTKAYGADTCLLVPGVVNAKVTYQECWDRSTTEVKKFLPLAEKLGVKIAIEVVWNNFLTKPEQLVEYVDQFQSPWVGAYFDASNMLKYGVESADWIRKLGKRMLKMDFKGYSRALAKQTGKDGDGFKAKIGEGDENWPEVLKACKEVGYSTWATAEVSGGGEKELMDISQRMDKILQR